MRITKRLHVLPFLLIFCTSTINSQVVIDLKGYSQETRLEENKSLIEVFSVLEYPELVGILQNKKEKDTPVFLKGGVEEAVENIQTPLDGVPDDWKIAIQVQKFWLTNELPKYKGDGMNLEVEIVFFRRDMNEDDSSWIFLDRYRGSHMNQRSESPEVITQLIMKSFDEMSKHVSSVINNSFAETTEQIRSGDLTKHFYADGLDPTIMYANAKGKTGVIDKFEDVVQGDIRTDFEVKLKSNVGGDAYKVRIVDVPLRYQNWGAVIDGRVYKKCPWGYQRLYGDEHLTTYVFPEANNSGANAGIAAAGMGYGFIGGAIAGAIIGATSSQGPADTTSVFYYDWVHELDLKTGGLKYVVTNPRKAISHTYSFLHSSFSKSDTIELTFKGQTHRLAKNEYTKFRLAPTKDLEVHELRISDGVNEEFVPLSFDSFEEEYNLVICRKKGIDLDEMSGYEMRNKKPSYSKWPEK